MTRINRIRFAVAGASICSIGIVSGCGAPDLSAMHPHVQKRAAAVLVVGTPNFMPTTPLTSTVSDNPVVLETVKTSNASFLAKAGEVLSNSEVTTCVVAVDDAGPLATDISQLTQKYANVHFDILSNRSAAGVSGANVAEVYLDANSTDFAIGWLVGVWANNLVKVQQLTQQPAIGYSVKGVSTNAQKAFFAGLYTVDPAAQVVPMTPVNGPNAVPPIYPTVSAVVVGGTVSQSVAQTIGANAPFLFDLTGGTVSAPAPSIVPGHLAPSQVTNRIAQMSTGTWQAGDQPVVDTTGVAINPQLMPPSVVSAWNSLSRSLAQAPTTWQSDYAKLPTSTQILLKSEFGVV
ncbi:hypothetical protein [Alicyclobacillus fastidiosus]|uniref:Uncharacterized protein n=1 Tax=Alicyclobacillus fastidiosus TaxID=392011 RepID=A0ABV5AI08_9BACL|nr:hypothetical protein [Alicyclobacillus fastidiosus]WEH07871.1 hypothetical protein PYS47_13995 [Alicyclobacillus fastidiosus]